MYYNSCWESNLHKLGSRPGISTSELDYVLDLGLSVFILLTHLLLPPQAHYRSGSLTVDGEPTPRWLAYVQAARDRHEQTVEAFRDPRGYIFYR